ncbi:MAG TPA: hypothetical protein PKE69_27935 [Pyrinomonadaceae bacterium]|nr:hypothetical protein [Pyrinomonadaceae bacterium]
MDAYKLHLLLNHYPMFGIIVGILLLLLGLWRKSEKVKRISLWIFLVSAVLTFPVYVSGEIAGSGMTDGIFGDLIKQHKQSALIAFGLIEATGIAALIGLILLYRRSQQAKLMVLMVLVLSLASSVFITKTTLMGRNIKWGLSDSGTKPPTSFQR